MLKSAGLEDVVRDTRTTLSFLWIWALFNYVYGDIVHIFTIFTRPSVQAELAKGSLGGIPITDTATLIMAAVMELSIAMPFLSWKLRYRACRVANILVGTLFTLIMGVIIFGSGRLPPLSGYTLYGIIEMAITAAIVLTAWRWKEPADQPGDATLLPRS